MAQRPTPPRGMRDLLPDMVRTRRELLDRIIRVFERYGFSQIETPLVEEIDRLLDSEGGENEKLIYKILRRGIGAAWPPASEGEAVDLGLRFDLTVPLARYYASNSESLPHPFKAIQAGPVFRAERPQKGRYRQFTQCDIDVIGDASLLVEVELISAMSETLRACDVGEFVIRLNDRRLVESLIRNAGYNDDELKGVLIAVDKLDKLDVEGVRDELLRINDGLPTDRLCELLNALHGTRGFAATLEVLASQGEAQVLEGLSTIVAGVHAGFPWASIELDPTLVRGMGYYTGPIFEVEHAESAGSLGGGGRYDNMVRRLAGFDAPAAGFSIGFERLSDIMHGKLAAASDAPRIALLHHKNEDIAVVSRIAQQLRTNHDVVRREAKVKNRAAQMRRLLHAGFTHWVDIENGAATAVTPIRDEMDAKKQKGHIHDD